MLWTNRLKPGQIQVQKAQIHFLCLKDTKKWPCCTFCTLPNLY